MRAPAGRQVPRHPDEVMQDFAEGCQGRADIDMKDVLHEIIDDIVDTVDLALSARIDDRRRREAIAEVGDYVANHYGDD